MLDHYARLNDFLTQHNPDGTYLFEDFGWAETVFASRAHPAVQLSRW